MEMLIFKPTKPLNSKGRYSKIKKGGE